MRNKLNLIEFKVVDKFLWEVEMVLSQMEPDEDNQWASGAAPLKEKINDKILEIDMLLTKFRTATEVQNWTLISSDEAIKIEATNILNSIDTIEEEE